MSRQPSSGGRGRFKRNQNFQRGPRRNERIRAREIRVIGPEGTQLGVMSSDEALALAKQYNLDLVEIAATATPPVCRILDYGKYSYEQEKKQKDQKKTSSKLKEVKFRVRIEQHDYMTKLRHAEEFLYKGNKVKMNLQFRGRENEHKDLGFDVIRKAMQDLTHVGVSDGDPKLNGRNVTASMSPLPENKRKLKYNVDEEEEESSK